MTTAVNTFDMTKASAKIGKLHCDKLIVADGSDAKKAGWRPYTLTVTGGTPHASDVLVARYKIEGTILRVRGSIQHSANAGASASGYVMNLPTGCVPLSLTNDPAMPCGTAYLRGAGFQTVGVPLVSSAANFTIWISTGAGTAASWGHGTHADLRFSIGTTFEVNFDLEFELDPATSTALAGTF